jgi:predicted O-linked N-acetylglucosamine transferase (SPINDLY family)
MGLPVVTLAGRSHVARVGVTMLTNVGLSELIASDQDAYVAVTVKLGCNVTWLKELRQTLRSRLLNSPNMNGARFTHFLEAAYAGIWNDYCAAALRK